MTRMTISIGVLLFFVAGSFAQQNNMPVEAIIEKHIAACGGAEKLEQLHSLKLSGIYIYRAQDFAMTMLKTRPHFFRLEIDDSDGKQIYIFDGESARAVDAQSGEKKAIRDARVRHFVEMMADFDGALVDYRSKGHQVRLTGTETVEGQPAHVLEVTLRDSSKEHWFIDAQSFLLVKRTSTFIDDGQQNTQALYFMDYQPVDGFMIPHYFERNAGHYVYGYEIERVEIKHK